MILENGGSTPLDVWGKNGASQAGPFGAPGPSRVARSLRRAILEALITDGNFWISSSRVARAVAGLFSLTSIISERPWTDLTQYEASLDYSW